MSFEEIGNSVRINATIVVRALKRHYGKLLRSETAWEARHDISVHLV